MLSIQVHNLMSSDYFVSNLAVKVILDSPLVIFFVLFYFFCNRLDTSESFTDLRVTVQLYKLTNNKQGRRTKQRTLGLGLTE